MDPDNVQGKPLPITVIKSSEWIKTTPGKQVHQAHQNTSAAQSMCISLAVHGHASTTTAAASTDSTITTPLIVPLPTTFPSSFDPSQLTTRGNATWSTLFSTPHLAAGIASLPSNKTGTLSLHRHAQPELYFVLSGAAIVEIEGKQQRLEKGMTVFIPGDAEHGVLEDVSVEGEVFRWLYVFPSRFEDVEYRFRSEGGYGEAGEQDIKGERKLKAKL